MELQALLVGRENAAAQERRGKGVEAEEQGVMLAPDLVAQVVNPPVVVAVAVPQQVVALIPVLAGLVVKVSFASIHGR